MCACVHVCKMAAFEGDRRRSRLCKSLANASQPSDLLVISVPPPPFWGAYLRVGTFQFFFKRRTV